MRRLMRRPVDGRPAPEIRETADVVSSTSRRSAPAALNLNMNHKRKRPKNRRGGCLMCKSQKCNGTSWARRYPKLAAYAKQDERQGA